MARTHQGKNVTAQREAREGDDGYAKNTNQVVITLEDGTTQTVKRDEVVGTSFGW